PRSGIEVNTGTDTSTLRSPYLHLAIDSQSVGKTFTKSALNPVRDIVLGLRSFIVPDLAIDARDLVLHIIQMLQENVLQVRVAADQASIAPPQEVHQLPRTGHRQREISLTCLGDTQIVTQDISVSSTTTVT